MLVAGALAASLLAARAGAAPADRTDATVRQRLAAECDALIRQAAKTPYGWAWRTEAATRRQAGRNRVVNFDVRITAAAGLALHLAGERLGEERFTSAAALAAKSVAAVQANSGQFPATGVIRANAGGRDEPAAVPHRAATCAALALLLTVTHSDDPNAAGPTRRAAVKGAHWLASQQTRGGGWLVAYPPGAAPGEAMRLVRLDTPDYRDATLALWLAAHALGDDRLLARAEQSASDLEALRILDEKSAGHHLWTTAYNGDGTILEKVAELAPAIDSLASRRAMEMLLAACLLGDAEASTPVLKEAAAALDKLPLTDGRWRRRYDLHIRVPKAEHPDDPPVSPLFEGAVDAAGESETASGVGDVIRAANRLAEGGAESLKRTLDAELPLERRIGLVVCGLADDALTADAPPQLEEAAADDLRGQLRRIAALAWQVRPGPPNGEKLNGEKRTNG